MVPCPRFCNRCNARPARPGRTMCERCVPIHAAAVKARQDRLKAAGLCNRCGKRPIMEGLASLCTVCRDKRNEGCARWRDRLRAWGLY